MKVLFKNTGYFFKEIGVILKLDLLSNILSIISLGFIFLMLSIVLSGGLISSHMIREIQKEAEISVYYDESLDNEQVMDMIREIKNMDGVREVLSVPKDEAEEKMTEILGKESRIIQLFDHNPFSPYIEVKINLSSAGVITEKIQELQDVDLVRDNREILDRLVNISRIANVLGIVVVTAVSIATLIITSHIIRQGIYNNKDQINTLRLLGAPEYFITLPFILEGLLMTLLAGFLSIVMIGLINNYIYLQVTSSLPFLLLPPLNQMIFGIGIFIAFLSLILGLLGSMLGLKATKR